MALALLALSNPMPRRNWVKAGQRLAKGACLVAFSLLSLSTVFAQGTAFTYQGQLQNNGSPASGTYNLTFTLFNTNTSGTAVAGPVTNNAVNVSNGLFTVLIDFGPGVFTGETNWLQIGVESNGVSSFTTLTPRQELTPTPNAIYAASANTLSGTLSASQLTSIGNTNGGSDNFFVGGSGNATTGGFDNTANGFSALSHNTSGNFNTANGVDALLFNTNGFANVANGVAALENNTSGSQNTANGVFALNANTSGSDNVAEGYEALDFNTNDNELVAIGYQALQNDNAYYQGSSSGNGENTAIGYQALQLTTFGYANTAIGYQALNQNTSGYYNTANGDRALYFNTSGYFNTANGYEALYENTNGSYNTANGYAALISNRSGSYNTANGCEALFNNTSGQENVANGFGALFSNTSGFNNVANGFGALYYNASGSNNVANGYQALFFNTSGYNNTANGYEALYDNTNGYFNTADGYNALNNNTSGYLNTAMGHDAMKLNQVGYQNVAVGDLALGNCTNDNQLVAIGYHALENDNAYDTGASFSGNGENTAIGYQALQLTTVGVGNTAIGYQALQANTNGIFNTANGDDALYSNTSGSGNTAIGVLALYPNTNGSGNIALGYYAGNNLQSGSYNIYIGNVGNSTESGIIRIGQPGTQTATYLAGNVSIGGASPGQELSINGGMDVDAAASDNGTVNNAWTLLFGGATAGEGIGSVRVAGYGDSYGLNFYTDYNKRMTILQNGHVGIGTTNATQLLVVGSGGAYCNGTTWVNGSDQNSKEDFAAINPRTMLEKVSALPITEWQYKVDASGLKHIGPMAQDFHAAFGLNGADDKHIATVDEEGVALAAIQGLNQKLEADAKAKDAEIQTLKTQNDSLAGRLNELEATVKQLAANR